MKNCLVAASQGEGGGGTCPGVMKCSAKTQMRSFRPCLRPSEGHDWACRTARGPVIRKWRVMSFGWLKEHFATIIPSPECTGIQWSAQNWRGRGGNHWSKYTFPDTHKYLNVGMLEGRYTRVLVDNLCWYSRHLRTRRKLALPAHILKLEPYRED